MEALEKKKVIQELQERILVLEGFKARVGSYGSVQLDLGPMNSAFPKGEFPFGAVHEFSSPTAASATATNGFIAGLLSVLMREGAPCLWVSAGRRIYPPGLLAFGLAPDQVIFVDVKKDKDVLWVMEQGLKCGALSAVVAELQEVNFSESQRLQLAVEHSRVTGFLHRRRPVRHHALACVARWKVRPRASLSMDDMPGVGFSSWEVCLEKVKNGRPGVWPLVWKSKAFLSATSGKHLVQTNSLAKKGKYA